MEPVEASPRRPVVKIVGAVVTVLTGLALAGCGQQQAGVADGGDSAASGVEGSPSAPAETPGLATAGCRSGQSFGGTIDYLPPRNRSEAATWAQSALEAARNTQTAPAFKRSLGRGELVEQDARGKTVIYAVMQGSNEIGRITVRPVGHGAYATEDIEACSR